jgi:hypothetical protein
MLLGWVTRASPAISDFTGDGRVDCSDAAVLFANSHEGEPMRPGLDQFLPCHHPEAQRCQRHAAALRYLLQRAHPDADADADADSDADPDSDADTDAHTDTDTHADTDTHTDPDSDSDSDSDSNTLGRSVFRGSSRWE